MNKNISRQRGAISGLLIFNIVLLLLVLLFGSVMIWALVNYTDQKKNVDSKIEVAVAEAKKQQMETDEKIFTEREKYPYRQFVGPEDLGRVSFEYPKTWSVYTAKEGGVLETYLHPGVVQSVDSDRPFAARVSVTDKSYEQTLKDYDNAVKKGELKSSPVTVNGFSGNRLDGKFSKTVEGSMVVFKVRDKTLRVYTQSPSFRNDYNDVILKSLKFNP